MDNTTTSTNSSERASEEQPRPCTIDSSHEGGESNPYVVPHTTSVNTTKIAIENELKAWLSRPKPQLTDAPPSLSPPPHPPPHPPPPPPSNKDRPKSPRSILLPPTHANNVQTKSSVPPLDDEKVKTMANAMPMQMKHHDKLTRPPPPPPPPPPPQARRNSNTNNNTNSDKHNDSTPSIINIIQQRDDGIINTKKQHCNNKNGKKKHRHHHHRSNSSSSLPSSSNKHCSHHTNRNIKQQQHQQEPLSNIKNNSAIKQQGIHGSTPDFDILTFDQFTAANDINNNNGYHSDSSYMTVYSAPIIYNNSRKNNNKRKLRKKKKEQAHELYTQTLMERACGVVVTSSTTASNAYDDEDEDDAGSQTSRTSQKSFSSVFTTLKGYLRKGSNSNNKGGSGGYCSDAGISYNRTSLNSSKRRGGNKATSTRKKNVKYRSTNNTSVSADKYNNTNIESINNKKERNDKNNNNFGMSETDVTHTTVDSYSTGNNGSPIRRSSTNGNNGDLNNENDTYNNNSESSGTTKVFDLPWHDTQYSSSSNSSRRRMVGRLHGRYSGPVNKDFQPNGSGTLILENNNFLKFYGIWNNGMLVTNLMNEDEMKFHCWNEKKNVRLLDGDGYDSSASRSSCGSRMSNRSSRSDKSSRSDVSYRKDERRKRKKKKDKKKKKKKSSKEEGEFTTTNNQLSNVPSPSCHTQQQHSAYTSTTLATPSLAMEYDDPATATNPSNDIYNSNKTKNGVDKPPTRRKRRMQRYTLGEVARTPRDMVILRSNDKAIESASTLKKYDQAFLKRSNGLWTCSVLADRSLQPITTSSSSHWYTPDEIDGDTTFNNVEFEESMLFVIDEDGATKIIKKRHWGRFVRCMQKNDDAADEHATVEGGGDKVHGNDSMHDVSMQSFKSQV